MGRLSLDRATFSRDSIAFNPYTGERVRENVLRRNPGRLRVLNRMFQSNDPVAFAPGMLRMTYAQLLTRMATFEANLAGFITKTVYGSSFESKDLVAYCYGDEDLPAILFIGGVHGNEVDGIEGFFTFLETLHARRNGAWKAILAEHCIRFIPSANPDGWENNLRNLVSTGPNGETVNLNRTMPYFWDEYIESSVESKGAAPAGEVGAPEEAQALYDYIIDEDNQIEALVDHHENIGQGHRYISANRVNSFGSGARFNTDFDALRLQGSMRRARTLESLFVQFRKSKNVPHIHSWAASLGIISMAMESRKDEPEGATGNNKWVFDASFAVCVGLTQAYWRFDDTYTIEQEATNLVDGQEFAAWQTDNVAPSGFSRSRCVGERSTQELFPHNSGTVAKVTPELAVDPDEASPDWKAVSTGDVVLALGRKPSIPGDIQTMILASETVSTQPGPSGTPSTGMTRGCGMVYTLGEAGWTFAIGGWDEDGNAMNMGGIAFDAFNLALSTAPGSTALPAARADVGFANDLTRYSVFVGGCVGVVSSPFVAPVDGKILLYDNTTESWSDTGLTIPARKHACVVHRPGTDEFWIFGGEDASGVPMDDIWVYDRLANTVTESSTVLADPMTRIVGAAYQGDCIYLYGGRYEVSPGVYENDGEVRKFVPSTEVLTVESILANIEDEASHDETPWFKRLAGGTAARRVSGNGTEIFLVGGKTGEVASEVDQPEFYVHRPDANTITFARDGTYALFSRLQDIAVSTGDWLSISTWAKTVVPGSIPYHRAALTLKNAGGSWLRHGRTYYEVPFSDRYQWFRTAIQVKAGETDCRPYLRTYVHDTEILYAQHMVARRSRASSYHPTTREAETLTFSENINLNNFRLKILWNPTYGFVNVGEDLELFRIASIDDPTDYISLTLMEDAGKTYHSGSGYVAAQYPRVLLRKFIGGVQVTQVEDYLYYGYDCRSSNVEHVDDPHEFEVSHQPTAGLSLGIIRWGWKGYAENRAAGGAFAEGSPGRLTIAGEGEYGIPELLAIKTKSPIVNKINRAVARRKALVQNCIHPGEPNAA